MALQRAARLIGRKGVSSFSEIRLAMGVSDGLKQVHEASSFSAIFFFDANRDFEGASTIYC